MKLTPVDRDTTETLKIENSKDASEKLNLEDDPRSRKWWKMGDDLAAQCITSNIRYWYTHQTDRTNNFTEFSRIYANIPSNGGYYWGSSISSQERQAGQYTDNAAARAVDTLVAHIGANTVRPDFAVTGGDWTASHQAEQLNMFSDGVDYENDTNAIAEQAIQDACVWGPGFVYVGPEFGRIKHVRVLPMEIWVDETEAQLSSGPRQLHWTRQLDRDVAKAMWPEHEQEINDAQQIDLTAVQDQPTMSDMIGVIYSWRLPNGPKKKTKEKPKEGEKADDSRDGCMMITVSTSGGPKVLSRKVWNKPYFPIAMLAYDTRPMGWWPQGGIEQTRGLQEELDFLNWVCQDAYHLINTVKLWYKTGSGFVPDHANNDIINAWTSNEPPQWMMAQQIIPPEILQRIAIIPEQILAQFGVNQLAAQGQLPEGLEGSGEAQRVYAATGDIRLSKLSKRYERFRMDIAKLSICELPDALEQGGTDSYEVTIPNRESLQVIDWKDIKITDMDGFRVRCFPTSSLPSDIPGRLKTAQELAQQGIIGPDQYLDILNMPDIKRLMTLQTSGVRWITKCLDKIVNEGKFTEPEPYDNLSAAIKTGQFYYQRAKDSDVPEKRLKLIRRWIDSAKALVDKAAAEAQAKAAAAAQAAAMPPPGPGPTGAPPAPMLARPAHPPINTALPLPPAR